MLETTECISIKNLGRDYTDCMEFSLLRFTHMIFYSQEQIDKEKFSLWVFNSKSKLLNINKELLDWNSKYPNIYKEGSYYTSTDSPGCIEREHWAQFVSDKPYFEYYRNDGAELFTNVKNIIIFCKEIFGIKLNLDDYEEDNLNLISKVLSEYTGKKIIISISSEENKSTNMDLNEIKRYISKPQTDIDNLKNPRYNITTKRTFLNLKINSILYEWTLLEVYFTNDNIVSNKFITGHSVINNKKNIY